MPTISEYARARGVSHQYISKLAKKGMPLTSFEAADLWREAHASSKASTSPIRIARVTDEGNGCEPVLDHNAQRRALKNKLTYSDPPSESALEAALTNARQAANEAWRLLCEAMIEGKASRIQVLLNIHNKALEARLRVEVAYREELERRKTLVPLADAMEMTRRVFDVILSRLKVLPQNVAARCNPADPHIAMTVLENECAAILTDAQQAVQTLPS
jgi:hypothetical protein